MLFFFNDTATTEIYTLSLHDALPISAPGGRARRAGADPAAGRRRRVGRSEEHTSELQSQSNLVCRLLLEKKKDAELALTIGVILHQLRTMFYCLSASSLHVPTSVTSV